MPDTDPATRLKALGYSDTITDAVAEAIATNSREPLKVVSVPLVLECLADDLLDLGEPKAARLALSALRNKVPGVHVKYDDHDNDETIFAGAGEPFSDWESTG